MKKYLSGMIALMLAIGSVAFTKHPTKNQDTYFFAFPTNQTYSENNVENESLWVQTTDANACTGSAQKACVVEVPASYTNAGTPRTLKTTANLEALQYMSTGIYYVSSAASGITRYNKAQ